MKPISVWGLHGVKIIRFFRLYCGWIIQGGWGKRWTKIEPDIFRNILSCNCLPGKSWMNVIIGQTNRCDLVIKNKTWRHFLNCLVSKTNNKYGILKPHLQSLKLQKSPTVRNSFPPVSKYVNIIVDFTWYMQYTYHLVTKICKSIKLRIFFVVFR